MRVSSLSCIAVLVAGLCVASRDVADGPGPATRAVAATQPLVTLDKQFVFPGSATQGEAVSRVQPPAGSELVVLHAADNTTIVALYGKPLSARKSPLSIIYFYGNGTCTAESLDVFDRLRRLGASVIIPDYEGYGLSDGAPSERGCYATADAVYEYLLTREEVDRERIIVVGWSLGGAVAIDLASRKSVAGLVTFSAFDNIANVAANMTNGFPAGLLLASRFDNQTKIARITCPILLIHGARDSLVPFEMMNRLAQAATAPVTMIRIDQAKHNDIFLRGGEAMWRKVGTFADDATVKDKPPAK